MYYHYTFRTYKGKSCLKHKQFKDKLGELFKSIAEEKGFNLIEYNILEDHVHILLKHSSSDSTNYVMRMMKGISARRFFQEYPSNRLEYRKLWGRGYYAKMVKEAGLPIVINYIKQQIKSDGYDKRY